MAEIDETHKAELADLQNRTEEQLTQMKEFYDLEKEKLEKRISEEKERSNRRMGSVQDEFKAKLQDEVREKDHSIECLQN
jgi:ElaB/YqjD/DUF883 family membrane-anchored ribosome-binding protein